MIPRSFVGGFSSKWGQYATWPLVRLTLDDKGGTIGPSVSFLRIAVPTFTFDWPQVDSVGPFRGGVRFRFRVRLKGRQRWGPWAWCFVPPRQLTFWCRRRDWDAVWAAIPASLWSKAR